MHDDVRSKTARRSRTNGSGGRSGRWWPRRRLGERGARHGTGHAFHRVQLRPSIEDIDALIAEAGGAVHLFGASSGGALALEAAAAGPAIDRIAVYEVPYMTDDAMSQRWSEYVDAVTEALAGDRRADAIALFMRLAGSSDEDVASARTTSFWPDLEALAPTLARDAACLGDGRPPVTRLATITRPTLVATGKTTDSPMGDLVPGFFDSAADAIAAALPNAERRIVEGQSHVVDSMVFASVLEQFFTPPRWTGRPRSPR